MIDWVTINQACEYFHVTRRTIERWRHTYHIREAHLTKRHPIMLNLTDLKKADAQAHINNRATC